jgi:prophage regulatory protein
MRRPTEYPTQLPNEGYVRLPTVVAVSGLKRSAIYDHVKRGNFPKPIKLTSHASAWRVQDIEAWLFNPTAWRADVQAVA